MKNNQGQKLHRWHKPFVKRQSGITDAGDGICILAKDKSHESTWIKPEFSSTIFKVKSHDFLTKTRFEI